ncbi:xylulokinase [Chitinophaga costaii]|uniref:Xylulokinase n=1 Tax=Chitinophaga costaii TaxID=1335309 RepID=A0A1C4C969_9BACT|nr:FGGY family carbohydrate kinase [Chitinophaga costaii]PUZ27183.1 carbohydrate kinase [Chitinophaga costaii]SCC15677.1 xylulokinase [Chitinophaga costaii]
MLLLGIDVGTSSIKVSVTDAATRRTLATAQYPDTETPIVVPHPDWAEQAPDLWWDHVQQAILRAHASGAYHPEDIGAIGIAYQMHGLVMVNKAQEVLRPAIIWCDSRAVKIGEQAFAAIGTEPCLRKLLNSPGNFTAAKLAWVKAHEPQTYAATHQIMLPGDFIALRLTGHATTTIAALSEGIFWDFENQEISSDVMQYFGFDSALIPPVQPVFSEHGGVTAAVAKALQLKPGTPVTYKAGDQPNNALSLNVLQPGEVAATAGTSGVIYGVSDQLVYDHASRINTFAHVNHNSAAPRLGVLLCINGTGILYRWVHDVCGGQLTYPQLNAEAATAPAGSEGLRILPFGNGAERMLQNKIVGTQLQQINLNLHTRAHVVRAAQEGIAFAFRYGLDIMRENGISPSVIRAGMANLFLSDVFTTTFVNITGVPVELYQNDGSVGAALGAGIGVKAFTTENAFENIKPAQLISPHTKGSLEADYQDWKQLLEKFLA